MFSISQQSGGLAVKAKFSSIALCALFLLGCDDHAQPALYEFIKARSYLYTDKDLTNNSYPVAEHAVIAVCGRNQGSVALCGGAEGQRLWARDDDLRRLVGADNRNIWHIKYTALEPGALTVSLKPDDGLRNFPDLQPAVWFSGAHHNEVSVNITPARCAVQMAFMVPAEPEKSAVRCEQLDSVRSVIHLKTERIFGLRADWDTQTRLVIRLKQNFPQTRNLVLDPGHGFLETGTIWSGPALSEKDLALETAVFLKSRLESTSLRVVLTRDAQSKPPQNGRLTLRERIEIAERHDADLMVSLHFDNWQYSNLLHEPPAGLSCYYRWWFSKPFAHTLCREISRQGANAPWIIERELGVLGSYQFPSILLEVANLASAADRALIQNKQRFEVYLSLLADELRRFFDKSMVH